MAKKSPQPKVRIVLSQRAASFVTIDDAQKMVERMIKRTKEGQHPQNGKLFKDDHEFHVMVSRYRSSWRATVFMAEDVAGL